MNYKKTLTFRLISMLLVLLHICVFYFRDAAIVFAQDNEVVEADSKEIEGAVADIDSEQSGEGESQQAPKSEEGGEEPLPMDSGGSESQSSSMAFNSGALQNLKPSLFTGALTYSLPIAVPAGRKGIQPNIALTYSSQNGNGSLGMGWFMDLGSIERSTKRGVPKYDSSDTFIFKSGGSTVELVNIGGNEFRAKIEEAFMKFTFDGNSWIVKDKSGITYYFGQTTASQQNNGSDVFKWCLDKVQDTLGNYMSLTYIKDEGQIYPDTIDYTGNDIVQPNLSSTFQVDFDYIDSRADYFFSYRSNYLIKTNKLLSTITAKQNGSRIRKYALSYQQSLGTKRMLLSSIVQYGLTDSSSLPPIEFTYQEKPFTFSDITTWGNIHDFGNNDWKAIRKVSGEHTYVDALDINRDGLTDRVFRGYTSSEYDRLWVQLNNGSSFDNLQAWSYIAAQSGQNDRASIRHASSHCYMNTFDINGDALPDRIHVYYNNDHSQWEVEINNGSGFDGSIAWTNIAGSAWHPEYTKIWGFTYDPPVWGHIDLFDINGDGKPDRVFRVSESDRWRVQLNNGSCTFDDNVEWLNVQYHTHSSESYIRTGGSSLYFATFDINGDGLPDHLMDNTTSDNTWQVQFNNGRSFEDRQGWGPLENLHGPWSYMGYGDPVKVSTVDINGDGLPDRVMRNYDNQYDPWQVQINNGHSFEPIAEWGPIIHNNNSDRAHIRAGNTTMKVDFFDINGDGLPDRIMLDPTDTCDHWDVQLNNGPHPDLLETISNGIEGEAQVVYDTYIGHDNTESADKGNLGFPVNVVTQIQTSDGRGSSYSSSYSYDKGKFDYSEREFRGFGKVTATDVQGNYSISYFHQGDYDKGRTYKQETYDSSGVIQAKTESDWFFHWDDPWSGYPDSKFLYLAEVNNYTYNNGNPTKRTKTEYHYWAEPHFGNPTHIYDYGEVNLEDGSDIGEDMVCTYIGYVFNDLDWILNLPVLIFVYDINDNDISQKFFYYEGHEDLWDIPLHGLLTYEGGPCYNPITGGETWTGMSYDYDDYGNLISATDSNGNTTTTTYDSTYHIYPLTVTNALGHTVATQYYGVNGIPLDDGQGFKGLFGQIKSAQDPNAVISYNTYDDLGRLEKSIGPNDSIDYPAAINEYDLDVTDPLADPLKLTKRIKVVNSPSSWDYPDYYISYSFYDGMGRLIESKSPAEADPQTETPRQIISGITEYNSRGMVDKKYLPYFVDSSPDFVAPTYAQAYSSFQYDGLGRVIQTTNPDLTYSTTSYSDWTVTVTDEEGHYKTYYYDARKRLIQVNEHNDGQTYSTTYAYDTLGNLIGVTDNQGNTTTITYDTLSRKVQMNDPDMGIWSYEYDDVGNLTKQTDAAGQELEFSYDALNRLTQKTIQQAQAVTYEYDDPAKQYSTGRLTKVTYEAGQTEFFYDNLGREVQSIKTVDGIDYDVQRTYDSLDRLATLTYPDIEVVNYTYNPQGIETVVGSSTYVSNIDYSQTSQITKIEYGNGVVTTYDYDPQTLRLEHLNSEHQGSSIQDLQYTFDNVGNILGITDNINTGTQTFEYDDLSRLAYANGASYGAINYSYDSTGNILTKGTLTLDYSDVRPHAVSSYTDSSTGHTVDFAYDDNGNMQTRTNQQTNEQTSYYYDYESHLIQVEQIYPQGQQVGVTLEFEQGWNFFSLPVIPDNPLISDIFSGFAIGDDYDQISRYDPATGEFNSYVGDPIFDEFDTLEFGKGYCIFVNNPAGMNVIVTGTTPTLQDISLATGWNLIPYPYLSSRSTQQALGNLEYGVDYDLVLSYNQSTGEFIEYPGSLTELEPNKSYYLHCLQDSVWNLESLSRTTDFYYDGDGGRVKRRSEIDSAQTTTYIGSLFEKLDYDDPGQPTVTKKHIYAGSNRVCVVEDGAAKFYHGDHLGSSNLITDENGAQIALYEYRPFGAVSSQSGTYATDIKFTGKIQDDTGLYYYGARYYDPVIGRFISPDTIVQAPQDPQTLNRYAYCRNNPVKYVDPTGHWWFIPLLIKAIVGAAIGSLVGGALAAITGGDIGQGFAMGAISGAVMGGIGGFGFKGGLAILAKGVGGAASGAINASVFGGDVGRWAMVGGLSGLAFGSISQLGVAADGSSTWQWDLGRMGLSGVAGGAISEIAGGSFGEGAAFAGAFAGADFLYRGVMNTNPKTKGKRGTMKTAGAPGQPRLDKNNKPLEVDVSKNPNTVGLVEQSGASGFVHFLAGETGPVMNFFGMRIPGFQDMSKFHDNITTGFRNIFGKTANSLLFNFPSMAPSYAINVMSAAMNDYPALVGQSELYGEESN